MDNSDSNICQQDELENIIRSHLTRDKVQLWFPPYTTEEGLKGEKPQALIDQYSSQLGLDSGQVEQILERLRQHAVDKLSARKRFQMSGVATVKVRMAGLVVKQGGPKSFTVEIPLDSTGLNLKHRVAEKCQTTAELLKLICCGRIIQDNTALVEQNVKNNATVMAVGTTEAARRESEYFSKLAKTKEAAQLLSESIDDNDPDKKYEVQIADQTGKPLKLPAEESKALALAMTLHEKGKSVLKQQQYSEGLLYLLEADEEFKKCRADILNCVDNYAVLCLDIVWCYLCMRNIRELPDAEVRLTTCEQCFYKSYGANLERLKAVKGEVGTETALFMRLHLLQGILSFHQGRVNEAMQLLRKAESELKSLQVDDEQLTHVMAMGFTHQEARLGLRACDGNVEAAVQHIMRKQEEKKEQRLKERDDKEKRKRGKDLGKTNKGTWLDVDSYESMLSMGFPPGVAREALRLSENDVTAAIQVLQEKPELYNAEELIPITDELIAQVACLGFDYENVRCTLRETNGNVQKAIDILLAQRSSLGGTSADTQNASTSSVGKGGPSKSQEDREKEKEAIESLLPDIAQNEEDYLDLALDKEAQFLADYLSLLSTLKPS